MTQFTLAALARLALKNHQELQTYLQGAKTAHRSPFSWALQLNGAGSGMSLSTDASKGMVLAVTRGPLSYELTVPRDAAVLNNTPLTLTIRKAGTLPQVVQLNGSELLQLKLTPEYQELHESALAHLRQFYVFSEKDQTPSPTANQEATAGDTPAADASAPAKPAESEYEWITVERANQPNLKFKGKLVAQVRSPFRNARQYVFSVFKTEAGAQIGIKQGVTHWFRERDTLEARVIENGKALVEFFGYGDTAKQLYKELGDETVTDEVIA